jgi:hypothetical protein
LQSNDSRSAASFGVGNKSTINENFDVTGVEESQRMKLKFSVYSPILVIGEGRNNDTTVNYTSPM